MVVNIAKKNIEHSIIATVFIIMIMFSRGTILGNVALKISFFAGVTCVLYSLAKRVKVNKKLFFILAGCVVFFGYCFIQGMILNNASRYPAIVENTVYWIVNVFAAMLLISDTKNEKKVGKILILVLCIFVMSYIVTLLLGFVISIESLHYATIDYVYFYDAPVYFPITIAYGAGQIGSIDVIRMLGFGRECGITQTFYIWAFYKCEDYFDDSKTVKLLMGLGVLFCFSTTGLVIFTISFIINIIMKNRQDRKNVKKYIILLLAVIFVLSFSGTYSISNRIDKSYGDRVSNILVGLSNFRYHPIFGIGHMKQLGVDADLSDICFLASIGKIGIIGATLFLMVYIIAFRMAGDKKKFIMCNMAFFLTTMLTQPLYLYPLIYVMLFMNYDKNEKMDERCRLRRTKTTGQCLNSLCIEVNE